MCLWGVGVSVGTDVRVYWWYQCLMGCWGYVGICGGELTVEVCVEGPGSA